jgi:hypothetical protein
MEIGKAITFIPNDKNWIGKMAIAGGIMFASSIIPLIPLLFLIGYQVAVAKNVMKGEEEPLPEWQEWGQLFMDGVVVWAAQFVYAIPVALLTVCVVLTSLAIENSEGAAIAGTVVFSCLLLLFAIALVFIMPALYIQYIRYGDFGPMFKFGEVIAIIRENFIDILLTVVVAIAGAIAIGIISIILVITICGPIITYSVGSAWLMISLAFLYGQIASRYAKSEDDALFAA